MKAMRPFAVILVLALTALSARAESEFFKQFKDAYNQMGSDLAVKPPADLAQISNFIYQKDVATFTFISGKMYLLRHVDGRPTTAIFLGEGHASIRIPSHVERQSLVGETEQMRNEDEVRGARDWQE